MQVTAPRFRRTLAATSVAAVLALTAACGSDDASSGSSGSDGAESTSSTDSGEATELDQGEIGPAVVAAQEEAGSYAFAVTAEAARTSTDGEGEVELDGETTKLRLDMNGMEVIKIGEDAYVKASGQMDTGGKYFKVGPAAKGIWQLLGGQQDPADMLKVIEDPSEFEVVGHEDLGGVDTVHYRLGISRDAYLAGLGEDSPLAQMGDMAAKMLPEIVYNDVWLNGEDQVLKYTNTLEMKVLGKEQTSNTEMTFSDYGSDFGIEAPAADQLTDVDPFAALTNR